MITEILTHLVKTGRAAPPRRGPRSRCIGRGGRLLFRALGSEDYCSYRFEERDDQRERHERSDGVRGGVLSESRAGRRRAAFTGGRSASPASSHPGSTDCADDERATAELLLYLPFEPAVLVVLRDDRAVAGRRR